MVAGLFWSECAEGVGGPRRARRSSTSLEPPNRAARLVGRGQMSDDTPSVGPLRRCAPRVALELMCSPSGAVRQRRAEGASSLTVRVHTTRAAGAERASYIAAPTRTRGRTTEARMDAAGCIIMQWPARLLAPLLPRAARSGRRSGRRRRRRQLRRPQQLRWRLRQQPTYGPRGHPVFHGAACARGRPARTL